MTRAAPAVPRVRARGWRKQLQAVVPSQLRNAEANQFGELADLQPISSVFHQSIMEASPE